MNTLFQALAARALAPALSTVRPFITPAFRHEGPVRSPMPPAYGDQPSFGESALPEPSAASPTPMPPDDIASAPRFRSHAASDAEGAMPSSPGAYAASGPALPSTRPPRSLHPPLPTTGPSVMPAWVSQELPPVPTWAPPANPLRPPSSLGIARSLPEYPPQAPATPYSVGDAFVPIPPSSPLAPSPNNEVASEITPPTRPSAAATLRPRLVPSTDGPRPAPSPRLQASRPAEKPGPSRDPQPSQASSPDAVIKGPDVRTEPRSILSLRPLPSAVSPRDALRDPAHTGVHPGRSMPIRNTQPAVVQVSIGRLEIRAHLPAPKASPQVPRTAVGPRISLSEYLRSSR